MVTLRRSLGRLFLFAALFTCAFAQNLPTTSIVDTVFDADGSPAQGVLLISWPEFTTAAGQAVASGNTSTTLGAGGALSVSLVSNANATPANTVYVVVFQLDDGVHTEYWTVPTTSPTNLAAVRTILGAPSSVAQMATQQYVQTAVAPKANDNSVVHLAGSETITGVKQFTAAPSLPAPQGPNDGATKQYVDNSVQNVGTGNYVSISGATMTGPLNLSGAPMSSMQAADKSYVDLSVTSKADLIAGLVPTGEIGTGTANNGVCLHGDSTWGACGSSANAVSIQNVPVSPGAPTDNEVLTYVAAQAQYLPKPGGGVSSGMQAVKYATDFAWTQSPSTNLSVAGVVTVNLAACPPGVVATEPYYYVYIATTGTPEAVLVTGGTCAGNGQPGTLQFTTVNSHPAGYTIASASGGLQESLIVARIMPSNPSGPSQAGKVIVPPAELFAYARVSIRSSDITVDFSGSIVDCYMQDTCIFIGDPANANLFADISVLSPRGRPMVVGGQKPFLEVNAQKTRITNVATRIPPAGATFSSYVQVDGDQSFLLDGLDTALASGSSDYGLLCNATVCNPVIYAPGPFTTNPAVGWLKNLNISLQCAGNGIDWQSGNTVRISDSVVEGFAQYGVRGGIKRGGYEGLELDNLYEEVGNCVNPSGNIGEAGVIAQGATIKVQGEMTPSGNAPQFANTGSTDDRYYLVATSAAYGPSNPLYAGNALSSGSGNITVSWPDVPGATSFDLLRVFYNSAGSPREQAPYGTGNYAVAAGIARSSACANGVCNFVDTQTALQPYTVATPTYFPLLDFWPANLLLTANVDSNSVLNVALARMETVPTDVVAVQGMAGPAVIADYCNPLYQWTPAWLSCFSTMTPTTYYDQTALLLPVKPNNDGGLRTNMKGRLNFPTLGTAPGHIITLSDSNFQKTIATANNRPSNDVNDAFVGYDQGDGNPAHVGISFGAPVSISNYIGNVGDGSNWLERLTAGQKEFRTNVQMDSGLTVSAAAQATGFVASNPGTWALQGGFASLSAAAAGKSAIGFGANGTVQVSENGGAPATVATLDVNGNVSQNANTATQLAQTPAACNGSFASGIQANGNAICSTADILQLAETSQPQGIPNYGIFWFDSTCHCPKVIDNSGQAVQLGLLNVFNYDANTLEERNGSNPQEFRIYGNYGDSADYERLRVGWDVTDGYYFIGPDYAGSSSYAARGLGIRIADSSGNSSLRWVFDTAFNLHPWSNNTYNIGTPTQQVKNLYLGTGLVFGSGTLTGAHGTTGVAAEAGTLGNTVGAGLCNDGNGNVTDQGCTAGAVGSVFGRSGVVVAEAGDYSVAQVTGAAPLASPIFTGTPTAPTQLAGDKSASIATDAFVESALAGVGAFTPGGDLSGNSSTQEVTGIEGHPLPSLVAGYPHWNGTAWVFDFPAYAVDATSAPLTLTAIPGCGSTTQITADNAGQLQTAIRGMAAGSIVYDLFPSNTAWGSDPFEDPCTGATTTKTGTLVLSASTYGAYVTVGHPQGWTVIGPTPVRAYIDSPPRTTLIKWMGGDQLYQGNGTAHGGNYWTRPIWCFGPTGAESTNINGQPVGTSGSGGDDFCYSTTNNTQSAMLLENVRIDGNGAKNISCVVDDSGQENTSMQFSSLGGCSNDTGGGYGSPAASGQTNVLRIGSSGNDGNSAENSGPWGPGNIMIGGASSSVCTASAIALVVNNEASVSIGPHLTVNGGAGAHCSDSTENVGAQIDGQGIKFSGTFHIQKVGTGVVFGSQANTQALSVDPITCTSDVTGYCVKIANAHTVSGNLAGVYCQSGCGSGPINDLTGPYTPSVAVAAQTYHIGGFTAAGGNFTVDGSGNTVTNNLTVSGKTVTNASSNVAAGFNLPQGTAPSVPANGDLWTTAAGLYVQIAGSTVGPLGSGGSGGGGGMVYPPAGIPQSIGSAWGISLTAPASALVGISDTQTLTNKTVDGVSPSTLGYVDATSSIQTQLNTNATAIGAETTRAEAAEVLKAPLASPIFTGTPQAPTPSADNNSTKLATTAYVDGTYMSTWEVVGSNISTSVTVPFNSSTNHCNLFGITVPRPVTTSQISFEVVAADTTGTDTYDIGLYGGVSGGNNNLIVHTGALSAATYFGTASTWETVPWAGSTTVTLAPGRYYLDLYANEANGTATLASNNSADLTFYHLNGGSCTPGSGGTVPASVTGPTDGFGFSAQPYMLLH